VLTAYFDYSRKARRQDVEHTSRSLDLSPIRSELSRSRVLHNFFRNIYEATRDIFPGVAVSTTHFVSYPAWRSSFLAAFYDGARFRQLVLDYYRDLQFAPQNKEMAYNWVGPSNKVADAFNLLPPDERFNEAAVVAMVMQALPRSIRSKYEKTASHMNESLTSFRSSTDSSRLLIKSW
jgi:hypothetical protein